MQIMSIFAASNHKCGTKAANQKRHFFVPTNKQNVAARGQVLQNHEALTHNGLHRVGYRITTPRHQHL